MREGGKEFTIRDDAVPRARGLIRGRFWVFGGWSFLAGGFFLDSEEFYHICPDTFIEGGGGLNRHRNTAPYSTN